MCLADSRGRGYEQHMTMQKLFGPATFNIYGSRGTRTYPPRDEWSVGADSPADHNKDWVDGPIPFTGGDDPAKKFVWLPYLFNPLSSRDPDDTEIEDEYLDDNGDIVEEGVRKGRPPAIGGLPDKVAGYLQTELRDFSAYFVEDATYSIVKTYLDYDQDGYDFTFYYDYYAPPPAGIEPYDYDGYRLRIDASLSRDEDKFNETLVKFKTSDPMLPEVSEYIRSNIYTPIDGDWTPADTWSKFIEGRLLPFYDEGEGVSPAITDALRGDVYKQITQAFINGFANDIANTDIFDYGYDPRKLPRVIYFHEDAGGEFQDDLAGAIEKYGGSEGNPPFYIEEPEATGFTKAARAIVPEFQPCEEDIETIQFPNFTELKDVANSLTGKFRDDPRLARAGGDVTSIVEAPFDRALPAASAALNEALIFATIRVYIVEMALKALPVFNFLKPSYPDNYTNLISEYIIDAMEKGLKETGRGIRYSEKYKEYWFLFLEQVVQNFLKKVEYGMLDDQTEEEKAALSSITDYVERNWVGEAGYVYKRGDNKQTKKEKQENWQAVFTDSIVKDCKVILRRYVGEEINRMVPALASALPDPRVKTVDDLLLVSPGRPRIDASVLPPEEMLPYVAGSVNSISNGPVDVPGVTYYVSEGLSGHPLDALEPDFDNRDLPFVLERYVVIKDPDLSSSVHGLGEVINIDDWEDYTNRELAGATVDELYFGMRISYKVDGGAASIDSDLRPGVDYAYKGYSEFYKNLVPIASAEIKIDMFKYPDFSPSLYENYVQPLFCDLVETTEYKLVFKHCFPIARYMSFLAIYCSNVFVPSLGKLSDGWASTIGPQKKGGGQWIGLGVFGGMRTWRGNEGMKNSFHNTKRLARQLLESSCNTNYLYKDRDELSPSEQIVRAKKQKSDMDLGIKWWQWSSLRPPPCKEEDE